MTVKEELKKAWAYVKGDGCTASPDLFYGECCRNHDADYELGVDENGNKISRFKADNRLFNCMKKKGKTPVIGRFIVPVIYWSFVRTFGWKFWGKHRKAERMKQDEKV